MKWHRNRVYSPVNYASLVRFQRCQVSRIQFQFRNQVPHINIYFFEININICFSVEID